MPTTAPDAPGVSPRDRLFGMWELPAAWHCLNLCAPAGAMIPDLNMIVTAMTEPADYAEVVATLHARALNIPSSAASARWLPGLRRVVRLRRADFDPIFGTAPQQVASDSENESGSEKEAPNASKENEEEDSPLASFESYLKLTDEQRMLTLHTVAELCAVDAEVAPVPAGRVAQLEVEHLRVEPIGTDSAGNDYWYYGDNAHVFREPGRRAKKRGAAEAKRAAQEARRVKEEEKRARIEERKRIAAEKRALKAAEQEKRLKKREQERLARRAQWAPRAASARVTRASRAASLAASSRTSADTPGDASKSSKAGDKHPRSEDEADSSAEDSTSGGRSSKRPRISAPASIPAEDEGTPSSSRRKSTGSLPGSFAIRHCVKWEPICTSLDELRDFVEKFGDPMDISNRNERALMRFLTDELIPQLEETESRLRKERIKKERSEWLMNNQKRSSRVQAMEARREAEKDRERELEAERQQEELRKEQRQLDILKSITQCAAVQMKELRAAKRLRLRPDQTDEARRLLEADHRAEQDELRRRQSAVGKRGARVSMRVLRGSGKDSDDGDMEDVDDVPEPEEDDYEPESEQDVDSEPESADELNEFAYKGFRRVEMDLDLPNGQPSDPSVASGLEPKSSATPMDIDPVTNVGNETKPNGNSVPVSGAQQKDISVTHGTTVNGVPGPKLTNGSLECDIPDELSRAGDDGLPFRALNHFVFVSKGDCSEAPLEAVDNNNGSIVGLGVLVPPKGSEADPVRVELHDILEWVIEYGEESVIWVKTKSAWYELIRPHLDYRATFASALRKFEICVRLFILGDEMEVDQLGYEAVVDMLGYRYKDMKGYKESDIRGEYEFILSQVDDLKQKTLLKCGFTKELRNWKRTEERKAKKVAAGKPVSRKKAEGSTGDPPVAHGAPGATEKVKMEAKEEKKVDVRVPVRSSPNGFSSGDTATSSGQNETDSGIGDSSVKQSDRPNINGKGTSGSIVSTAESENEKQSCDKNSSKANGRAETVQSTKDEKSIVNDTKSKPEASSSGSLNLDSTKALANGPVAVKAENAYTGPSPSSSLTGAIKVASNGTDVKKPNGKHVIEKAGATPATAASAASVDGKADVSSRTHAAGAGPGASENGPSDHGDATVPVKGTAKLQEKQASSTKEASSKETSTKVESDGKIATVKANGEASEKKT